MADLELTSPIDAFLDADTVALAQQALDLEPDVDVLANIVADTSPDLGGDLGVGGYDLTKSTYPVLGFAGTGSANYIQVESANTGNPSIIRSTGTDGSVDLNISCKGAGKIRMDRPLVLEGSPLAILDTNDNELLYFTSTSSAANYVLIKNTTAGNGPTISAGGSDGNIDLILRSKGSSDVSMANDDGDLIANFANAGDNSVNYIQLKNSTSTQDLIISAEGTDTNIDLQLVPKGSGSITNGTSELALAQNYAEICIPAGAWNPDSTNPPLFEQNSNGFDVYRFDPSTEEALWISYKMPDNYAGGVLRWSVNWRPRETTETHVFGLSGLSMANDEAFNASLGTERTVTDTGIAIADMHLSPNDATGITLAGTPAGGEYFLLKLVVKTSGSTVVDTDFFALNLQYQTKTTESAVWS